MSLVDKGYYTKDEIMKLPQYPSKERFEEGPVAVIECNQEIPCNPCEEACSFGAITIGKAITNIPVLDEEKCTGCGLCIAQCPGLAIFVVDKTYASKKGTVTFPYEFYPLPEEGEEVKVVDRKGDNIGSGKIIKVITKEKFDKTTIITIAVPIEKVDEVRGIKPLATDPKQEG